MSVTGLNNTRSDVAKIEGPLMDRIRNISSELDQMFRRKGAEGSAEVSQATKGFSQESVEVKIRASSIQQGAIYPKPR